jgi:hypothetical protein
MTEKRRYKVLFNNEVILVDATRKEFMSSTGQTFFYDGAKVNLIAPKEALVVCTDNDLSVIEEFEQLLKDIQLFKREFEQIRHDNVSVRDSVFNTYDNCIIEIKNKIIYVKEKYKL